MKRCALLFVSLVLVANSGLPALAQFDSIHGASGAPSRGRITQMSADEVVLEIQGGIERRYPSNEIRRLTYANEPTSLQRGRNLVASGNYADGLEILSQIDLSTLGRAVVRQEAVFYIALAKGQLVLTRGGRADVAAQELEAFTEQYANSFHAYDAYEILGKVRASQGNYSAAVEAFRKLAEAPFRDYQMNAAILEASTLRLQGNFAAAQTSYENVISGFSGDNSPDSQRQRQLAIVGKASCMAETGQAEAAQSDLESIIERNNASDAELFSRAYNALGACHRKEGRTMDALLAYLTVDIMYNSESEAHAEALYYLTELWRTNRKATRSTQARQQLQSRYPGSPWTARLSG